MKAIHLIPKCTVGGVETAANSVSDRTRKECNLTVKYIAKNKESLLNPFLHLKALSHLFSRKPDVVVCSLWWTSFVVIIYWIIKRPKIVLFLHSQRRAHFFDRFFTFLQSKIACHFFVDSEATLKGSQKYFKGKSCDVISFIIKKYPFERKVSNNDFPVFVYWGRLSGVKRVDLAIDFFYSVQKIIGASKFFIYGPDFGERAALEKMVVEKNLERSVYIFDSVSHDMIPEISKEADFFLQLSEHEGMAMSVVESMQLGLVPIVTPVGQIPTYCSHLKNSVIYKNKAQAVSDFFYLWDNGLLRNKVSIEAVNTWQNVSLYKDDIRMALVRLEASCCKG